MQHHRHDGAERLHHTFGGALTAGVVEHGAKRDARVVNPREYELMHARRSERANVSRVLRARLAVANDGDTWSFDGNLSDGADGVGPSHIVTRQHDHVHGVSRRAKRLKQLLERLDELDSASPAKCVDEPRALSRVGLARNDTRRPWR